MVLARHGASGRLVAVKYLAARLVGDTAFALRFRREAELMALVRDPNVVEVYELAVASDGRGVALVMEAVEGPSLRRLLGNGHGSPEAALALLRGSLLGLAAAHDKGVVHRDYKPDNVLVDARGQSKLTDFGIASPAGQAGAPAEGTPAYMAPEQWNGYPPAPASDMYSAAVVFYECLTGVRPFRSQTLAELRTLHETAPPPLERVPPPVRGLLERGLAKYPQQRYADVRSFLADVESAAVAGYGPHWRERAVRDLAYAAAGMVAALPILALAAGTTSGAVGLAGASGAAGAAGAAGTGAAGAAGAAGGGAAGAGAAGLGHAAVQAGAHGAVAAGQAGGQAAAHAAGQGAAQAAVHGSAAAGQFAGSGAAHTQQVIDHTRRAATWSRRGAKLLHGKALAATVATVTVAAAGTTVAVATAGGSDDPRTPAAVAHAEESALHAFGSGNNGAMCHAMSSAMLKRYGGQAGCVTLMSSATGFLSSLGGSLDDQRKAARSATVDPAKVVITGDTALVPGSAVHWKLGSITVAGQTIDLTSNDVTWVRENGHWLIGMPKNLPSVLPTDLFPSGGIPTDLFPGDLPTSFPTDILGNLPGGSSTS
ncbi:MAG: hypothetical protein AUG49_01080 [Catenulispora sp. 13_1_20CM_3_70_7]|nr:MAG: hypothetical protein AUG49_01080 [Catenulispora sp. 13_1_20CM_3_70_7]